MTGIAIARIVNRQLQASYGERAPARVELDDVFPL